MRSPLVLALSALAVAGCTAALAVAGCTAAPARPDPTGPAAAPCVPLVSARPAGVASHGTRLPELTLACLSGGRAAGGEVRLDRLPGPAIVNLWASWCEPCRTELPAIQRYAAANTGRVTVLGVDTGDTRSASTSVIADLGIGYPNLYDPDERLLAMLGYTTLPITLFVDRTGEVRHVYHQVTPLTEQSLAQLAARYLGG